MCISDSGLFFCYSPHALVGLALTQYTYALFLQVRGKWRPFQWLKQFSAIVEYKLYTGTDQTGHSISGIFVENKQVKYYQIFLIMYLVKQQLS